MKQVTIKAKATILVIDIPDHHVANITHIAPGLDTLTIQDVRTGDYVFGVNGVYQAVGSTSQVTEEQWKWIVECWTNGLYCDYQNNVNCPPHDGEDYIDLFCLLTATESGLSLLKANGVVLENPRGDQPHNTGLVHLYPTGHPIEDIALKEAIDWLDAQEQVWSNPQLFMKL